MEKITTHRIGFSFAPPIIVGGVVLVLAGAVSILENPWLGVGLIVAGGFFSSGTYGTQINFELKQVREYGSFYGIKKGPWKSLNHFPFVSILSGKSGYTVYSRSNQSTSTIDHHYDVCLLNKNHRMKVVVQKFDSKDEATAYANQLAIALHLDVTTFNPSISKKQGQQ